ncbi:unnamed protein product [Bemisia tabaci]|uniref:Poly(A) RNA polymerase, mitochondrial n=2 Tax=Bemisia tabaci TaxID=7038 RepID=A0A9P0EZ24_BEMTA|nr:unnamed protein product [Bemisia tabaci]
MDNPYVCFDDMIAARRAEASRSILVQVQSETSLPDLYNYCCKFGNIKMLHYYSCGQNNFILIEFSETESVKAVLEFGTHLETEPVIPVRSPLLWFRTNKKKIKNLSRADNVISAGSIPYSSQNLQMPDNEELLRLLRDCETVSDQMMTLYLHSKLNDIGSRLRFLTARQIELMLCGVFPHIQAIPFGSSVNSYGKLGCDLDLSLLLDDITVNNNSRLVFQAKTRLNKRTSVQRQMEVVADLIQLLLPGCSHVRKILQARVPIVKFNQDLTFIECDLSTDNTAAIYMSELLYLLGYIDWRVRPLVFTVRWWAKEVMLTNSPHPGHWITNFSLTLLVIFFLQRENILPSLDFLMKTAGPEDDRVTEDGINCTFLRDLSKLPQPEQKNSKSLAELLLRFFEFYSTFDFATKAVSINLGTTINKPEPVAPMFIINPLERLLNVTKNMNFEETARLRIEAKNALSEFSVNAVHETFNDKKNWGLADLTRNQKKPPSEQYFSGLLKTPLKNGKRLVRVEELFNNTVENEVNGHITLKSPSSETSGTFNSEITSESEDSSNSKISDTESASSIDTENQDPNSVVISDNASQSKKILLPRRATQLKKKKKLN